MIQGQGNGAACTIIQGWGKWGSVHINDQEGTAEMIPQDRMDGDKKFQTLMRTENLKLGLFQKIPSSCGWSRQETEEVKVAWVRGSAVWSH